MATIEVARAIRKEGELGSLEPGKKADVAVLDLDRPHLTPAPDVVSALVFQAVGTEFDTVVCDGEVVVDDGEVTGVASTYPDLRERATAAAERIAEESEIAASDDR